MRSRRLAWAIVAGSLLLAGCSTTQASSAAGTEPVCAVLGVPYWSIMRPEGRSFAQVVDQAKPDATTIAADAATVLLLTVNDLPDGPDRALVTFLVDQFHAAGPDVDAEDRPDPPVVTDEVVASARQLDRDLAEGLCPEPDGS